MPWRFQVRLSVGVNETCASAGLKHVLISDCVPAVVQADRRSKVLVEGIGATQPCHGERLTEAVQEIDLLIKVNVVPRRNVFVADQAHLVAGRQIDTTSDWYRVG